MRFDKLNANGLVQRNLKPDPEPINLADVLLANYQNPEVLTGENGLLKAIDQDAG